MINWLLSPAAQPSWLLILTYSAFWYVVFSNSLKIRVLKQEIKNVRYKLDELKADLNRTDFGTIKPR